MLTSIISGLVFTLIAVLIGPAILTAGWQMLGGERVRLPATVKPLIKALSLLGGMLLESTAVVANVVAEQWPAQQAQWKPIVRTTVQFAIICIFLWMIGQSLCSAAGVRT